LLIRWGSQKVHRPATLTVRPPLALALISFMIYFKKLYYSISSFEFSVLNYNYHLIYMSIRLSYSST